MATENFYVRAPLNYYVLDYGDIDYSANNDNTIKNPYRIGVDLIWNF